MKRLQRGLPFWVAFIITSAGCDREPSFVPPPSARPIRARPAPPATAEEAKPAANAESKTAAPESAAAEPGKTGSESKTETASTAKTEVAAPAPAKPVGYDPLRDVALMQETVLELERLVNRGRFSQMRPYLDELYSTIGYLEARQPRPLTQLTVRRATHLIRKPDLKAAASEIARAQQELALMAATDRGDDTAKSMSDLLTPARLALDKGDRRAAEVSLEQIHLEEQPGDLSEVARGIRSTLAAIDLDIARQSARLLAMELKDLSDAIARLEAALKPPPPPQPEAAPAPTPEPPQAKAPAKRRRR